MTELIRFNLKEITSMIYENLTDMICPEDHSVPLDINGIHCGAVDASEGKITLVMEDGSSFDIQIKKHVRALEKGENYWYREIGSEKWCISHVGNSNTFFTTIGTFTLTETFLASHEFIKIKEPA